ncbi:hypothetical protein EV421DRAFT_1909075 [Armillaria borealis]|uniref:Uncharacterized protein n=1 Tax=Armillaria borealis TaxID=47425 RepID=A0AA39MH85_9AGAR|nr:hypothetical protein EV421DRAFT_1909075 [Armillaria borealis]
MDYGILGTVGKGTMGTICNILADSTMIWCCWMVWGQHYLIVVLPSLCLVSGTVFKIINIHLQFVDGSHASIARGIAPTLLIGHVAAGHAHPDDSWQGSIMSSLHFGQGQSQTGTQDSIFTVNLDDDPEAHMERTDEPDSEHVQTDSQRVRVSNDDIEAQLEEVGIGYNATTVIVGQ